MLDSCHVRIAGIQLSPPFNAAVTTQASESDLDSQA